MNEFDVMGFRRTPKEKVGSLLCCELINGNRFRVKRIEVKGVDVLVKLSDGTSAKPDAIKQIQEFRDAVAAQQFLLNQ